jgi:hypothetical protein
MMPAPRDPAPERPIPPEVPPPVSRTPAGLEWYVGVATTATLGVVLLAWALTLDFPRVTGGFFGDGATYYSLTYSLAHDLDFEYRRDDLVRVWREFSSGPEGIFLKRGRDVQGLSLTSELPFFRIDGAADWDTERLYYAKAFIYPLFAAPFVWVFGTNGFLVLHAVLMTICFACAYAFLVARSSPFASALFAGVFLLISAAPVYMVWLTPDFFNLALVLVGYFFWCYKEVVAESVTACLGPWRRTWLMGIRSDIVAAVLLGIATFSKPTHVLLVAPVLVLIALRRQWMRLLVAGAVFAAVVIGLFAWNVAITGDWNYQGGDRRTFYGMMGGFPFQNEQATFDAVGEGRATNRVPIEVLTTRDAVMQVFRKNLVYFFWGRHHGFVPYFFPGAMALALFLVMRRRRRRWQWLVLAGALGSAIFLILYMPFTYSGGGGPVANRYYLAVYPLFLFLTPPLVSATPAIVAAGVSALFAAQLITDPIHVSVHPAEHPKHAPYRWLPVEMTLVNDLPVNVTPAKARQPLGGLPPIMAYFLDDNSHLREKDAFWVRGESTADILIRAPIVIEHRDQVEVTRPLRVPRLEVQLETGPVPNRVTIETGAETQVVDIAASDRQSVIVRMPDGVPYRRDPWLSTNYVYVISIGSESGFIPLFQLSTKDNRFLGVFVRLVPIYE